MGSFEVVRATTIAADPARVHALIDDFHEWPAWSPWEDLDPDLQRTYTGPATGVGAHYAWRGNRKAGQGTMEITASSPERIDIDLVFMKPFDSASKVSFELVPTDAGTEVTWRMRGEQKGIWGVVGKVISMDRLVGKDFEKGLTRLKAILES
ncbi:SRPBCC family protein [Nocardioides endophyticus]|uniref:SRPBCC family protein n=1 Tax=Nocardioides endophyticus TaxID=1353775 RepID=A0ABP8YFC0_9ACTN